MVRTDTVSKMTGSVQYGQETWAMSKQCMRQTDFKREEDFTQGHATGQ